MNKNRRKRLTSIVERLEVLKGEFETILNEEQLSYDNLPERLIYSDRAVQLEDNVNELDYISGDLEDVICRISDIIER